MGFNLITELLTKNPTKDLDTVRTKTPITPGGLEPRNNTATIGKMQAGSLTMKWVVAIEGCKYLLSDAPSASVLAAWAGHDATEILGGLFVELQNSQSISPDDPFPTGGRCIIRVLDQTGGDTFGIYVNKRASGDKTTLTQTADRNDTTLNVASTQDFASSGDVYCGTECIDVTGKTATTLTGTRGKYSPFGCDSTGSGGLRFARHHRVSTDINTTLSNPVVSEVPRNWLGKFVGVYLHTWDEATQQLNTRANAQLVYAGRIVGIADNASDMTTDLEVESISAEFKNGVIGRDLLAGEVAPGIALVEGRTFSFQDVILSSTSATDSFAEDLVVVSGAPSDAYEVQAGQYTGDEICAVISRWLAQAKTDGDINGYYTMAYGVSSNVGPRTKLYYRLENANSYTVGWRIGMPGEVASFLGLGETEDVAIGQKVSITKIGGTTNKDEKYQGNFAPYSMLVFKPSGPGSIGQEFSAAISYDLENERGSFIDQSDLMPASVKESSQNVTDVTGLFLLDEKVLMIASYDADAATLTNCRLAPFQLASNNEQDAVSYIGRRIDDPPAPVTIRQVLVLEGPFKDVVSKIVYSTGASGYNHGTYDTLEPGLSLGIPGQLLGAEWDRSIANLPGAESPIAVIIDEPTKFGDLFRDDCRIRRAFIRWHDQGFEFKTWRTPLVGISQHTLSESNKAAPVGTEDDHRIASEETDQWHYSTVTIDYCRDFGTERNAKYLRSISLEDQSGTDGSGALGRKLLLKMRNTFSVFTNTGAAIEELVKEYLVGLPMFSRPSRAIVRSIDLRSFETICVGDICTVTDEFARDPLTGQRGINGRAGIVVRKTYNLGGPTPQGTVRGMVGEVEIMFLDTQRGGIYSPGAEIDHEKNYAGFSAGYNATTSQIWLKRSAYSLTMTVPTRRGPVTYTLGHDSDRWSAGDKIVICEIDPDDTASPMYWERTIDSVDGDFVTLTSGLSSPAWDATKEYRVFYDQYTDCTATQQDYVFQADTTDEMIQDEEVADQFASTNVPVTFVAASSADKAEFVADLTWGDGKPLDVGTDAALAKTINRFIDYKSAHQQPMLWNTYAIGVPGSTMDTRSNGVFAGIYHFGSDILSGAITRTLTGALWLRCNTPGSTAYARVTLGRGTPFNNYLATLEAFPFSTPMFSAESSRTATYEVTSTTWATTADFELSVAVKDLEWGCAWLVIETSGDAECRGFAKLVEGPRTNA
jgi:hypothetical protein